MLLRFAPRLRTKAAVKPLWNGEAACVVRRKLSFVTESSLEWILSEARLELPGSDAGWGLVLCDNTGFDGDLPKLADSLHPMSRATTNERDALLAAVGWLNAGGMEGVWLLTIKEEEGHPMATVVGLRSTGARQARLRWVPGPDREADAFSFAGLAHELTAGWNKPASWRLGHLGTLHLDPDRAAKAA